MDLWNFYEVNPEGWLDGPLNSIRQHAAYRNILDYNTDILRALTDESVRRSVFKFRGQSHGVMRHFGEEIADYSQAIDLDYDNYEAHLLRGTAHADAGDFPNALLDFNKIKKLNPLLATGYKFCGFAFFDLSDFDAAIEEFSKAAEIDSELTEVFYYRACAYERKGNISQAIDDLGRAIELDRHYAGAFALRAALNAKIGNSDAAFRDIDRAIVLDADPRFYRYRGYLNVTQRQFAAAVQDFGSAISSDPVRASDYLGRGYAFYLSDDLGSAIADFTRAIELDCNLLSAYILKGIAHFRGTEYDHTIQTMGQAIKINPQEWITYFYRGASHRITGDPGNAISDLNDALKSSLDPDAMSAIFCERGKAYMEMAEVEQAISDFTESLCADPENTEVYQFRGVAHLIDGSAELALKDLNNTRAADTAQDIPSDLLATADSSRSVDQAFLGELSLPLTVLILRNAVRYYNEYSGRSLDDVDEAIQEVGSAIESNPKDVKSLFVRGVLRSVKGDHCDALDDLDEATELAPTLFSAHQQKWLVHSVQGDFEAAALDRQEEQLAKFELALDYGRTGQDLASKDEVADAIRAFDLAIYIFPRWGPFYYSKAVEYAKKGDHNKAVSDFSTAIYLNPKFYQARISRSLLHIARGNFDEAIEDCEEALKVVPELDLALSNRAEAYRRRGLAGPAQQRETDLKESLLSLDALLQQNPENADYYFRRAEVHNLIGQQCAALEDYTRSVELLPNMARAHYAKGLIHLSRGDVELAIQDVSLAFELDDSIAKQHLDRCSDSEHLPNLEGDGAGLINIGNAYRVIGQLGSALRAFNKAVVMAPGSGYAYFQRGRGHLESGNIESAFENFEIAVEIDPDNCTMCGDIISYCNGILSDSSRNALALSCRGSAYRALGDYDRALKDLQDAIEYAPGLASARYQKGRILADLGNSNESIRELDLAICLYPTRSAYYFHRGRTHYANGNVQSALEDFETAIGLDPDNDIMIDLILQSCNDVIESDPLNAMAYVCRGNACRVMGDTQRAINDLKQALKLESASPKAYLYIALAYTARGDYGRAIESCGTYIELEQYDYVGYASRGLAYYYTGKYRSAIRDLDKSIEINPHDAALYRTRGLARGAIGDGVGAGRDFELDKECEAR